VTALLSREEVIRAWIDPVFRSNLPTDLKTALPGHPAGETGRGKLSSYFTYGDPVLSSESPSIDCTNTSQCFTVDPCECDIRTECSGGHCCV
jgi:mersacidin/lichenicidin family type 2 lantibiotic